MKKAKGPTPPTEVPFNPLDKKNLGLSVADALLARPVIPLSDLHSFVGAGVYAIYYVGNFPEYEAISRRNSEGKFAQPIYVGKAVPKGSRKGGFGLEAAPGPALYSRLQEHAETIGQTNTLAIKDFFCRYLVVDDIWIPLGESLLIEMFSPIWNLVIDGFGNHDPGSGRYNQMKSQWDELHPGRPWAEKLKTNKKEPSVLKEEVRAYIVTKIPKEEP